VSTKTLSQIARSFGAKRRALHERFQADLAGADLATPIPGAPPIVIPVPKGSIVELTISQFGVDAQVVLNDVVLPQHDTYVLDLVDGDNRLIWVITPLSAPWAYEVDLSINHMTPQKLDAGAGNSVGSAIAKLAILTVS
jgi:hypothetical protein